MTNPAALRFLSDRVLTASPAQRVVMLYDRALLDLDRARAANEVGGTHDASTAVMHALAVVTELQTSLDPAGFEGGPRLLDLYTWVIGELLACRSGDDLTRLSTVRIVLRDLRDAWMVVASSNDRPVLLGDLAG